MRRKPWRWTKSRMRIRTLLRGGKTPFEIEQLMVRAFDKHHPDARDSERLLTVGSFYRDVTEVAERIKDES